MTISRNKNGFTLIELITVISIILILMGLLFPAVSSVKEAAKKAQAKNDITNLVTSVKAYYTEYGKYPLPQSLYSSTPEEDLTYNDKSGTATLIAFMKILMAKDTTENPRQIVFIEPPTAKQDGKYGVFLDSSNNPGPFYDPWGKPYSVRIDVDYNNLIRSPDNDAVLLPTGVAAFSNGKDKGHEYNSPSNPLNVDDVATYK
ncbi:MAG: prepilin-type N-terminal cleavage/methylation domain-containing protein [Verrucomicrobiota bacterium]